MVLLISLHQERVFQRGEKFDYVFGSWGILVADIDLYRVCSTVLVLRETVIVSFKKPPGSQGN